MSDLTATQPRALRLIDEHGSVMAEQFARLMWPDNPAWQGDDVTTKPNTRKGDLALDTLDAMRLALVGAASNRAAFEALKALLDTAPTGDPKATRPVKLLLNVVRRRTTRLKFVLAAPAEETSRGC